MRQRRGSILPKPSINVFLIFLCVSEIVFIILFGVFVEYSNEINSQNVTYAIDPQTGLVQAWPACLFCMDNLLYPMFQDVHVMIFIGFGFLMCFLRRYGFSSVSLNFLLAAYVIQWHLLVLGFFEIEHNKIHVSVYEFLLSDFCAGAILISMGAVLGRLSAFQYVVMALLETVFYVFNEYVIFMVFAANDVGGSINLHLFGAYFGLTVSRILYDDNAHEHPNEKTSYNSNIFAMIGTLFLWLYWPSFNAAASFPYDARQRAILNTILSLSSCCVFTMLFSMVVNKKQKIKIEHVQNSTLAGGVAIGSVANLKITPVGSLIVGAIAAVVSVAGFRFLSPFLAVRVKLLDTCGVHNLHGIPGLIGGIVSIIVAGLATEKEYGASLFTIFPGRGRNPPSPIIYAGRSQGMQAAFQAFAILVSLGFAIVGGLITGYILKLKILKPPKVYELFADNANFDYEEEFGFTVAENASDSGVNGEFLQCFLVGVHCNGDALSTKYELRLRGLPENDITEFIYEKDLKRKSLSIYCSLHNVGSDDELGDAVVIKWFDPSGKEVTKEKNSRIREHSGNLFVNNIETDDAGTYTCKAAFESEELEGKVNVEMLSEPKWLEPAEEIITVKEQQQVEINCNIDDKRATIAFRLADRSSIDSDYATLDGNKVTIHKAERNNRNNKINCIAYVPRRGKIVDSYIKSIEINVQYAPEIKGGANQDAFGILEKNASIVCRVEAANPKVEKITFLIGEAEFNGGDDYQLVEDIAGQSSTLHIKTVADDHFSKEFRCHTSNAIGEADAKFNFKQIESPGDPTVKADVLNKTEIVLKISPPIKDGGAPITQYRVVYWRASSGTADDEPPEDAETKTFQRNDDSRYAIAGLHKHTEYYFKVSASNQGGFGDPAPVQPFSTSEHFVSASVNTHSHQQHLSLILSFLCSLALVRLLSNWDSLLNS